MEFFCVAFRRAVDNLYSEIKSKGFSKSSRILLFRSWGFAVAIAPEAAEP